MQWFMVFIGIVFGLFIGAVLGWFVGLTPVVIDTFNSLFSLKRSGDFFGGNLNAVVVTLPVLAILGSIVGGYLGYRAG
jgi:H+/Cl- antiporter ClcA|tara:strand:- start:217 stop:450 length:234 start_codon:yes stop_codon:yes gene_type:complete